MHTYTLVKLLRTLSKSELRYFGRFLEANSNKGSNDVKSLFNYLEKYHPTYTGKEIERNYVASKIFRSDTDSKALKKLDNSKLGLRKLLELFLIQEEVKNQKKEHDFLLLKVLRKRGLNDYFFKKIDRIEKEWTKNPAPGISHIHNLYLLKEMRFSHPNYALSEAIKMGPKMLLKLFEQYYIAVKLYWTLCADNTNSFFANKEEGELEEDLSIPIESILAFINIETPQNPQIKLLSEILNTFINKDFENYSALKESCLEQLHSFTNSEKQSLIEFLATIGFENYKLGNHVFIDEIFQLKCLLIIEENLLVENGYIANDVFIGIVNIACAAKKLEWAEDFINKYVVFIKEEEQEDVRRLTRAILYFDKKDYLQVLDELRELNFRNIVYGAQARAILLKAYFELGEEYDGLFYHLVNSFRSSFSKKTIIAKSLSKSQKTGFKNFINFTNKLHENKNNKAFDFNDLEQKILACNDLVYISWLLSKMKKDK